MILVSFYFLYLLKCREKPGLSRIILLFAFSSHIVCDIFWEYWWVMKVAWTLIELFTVTLKKVETWVIRQGNTLKFFFQGISRNIVSGAFHETWNAFMKSFALVSKFHYVCLSSIKNYVYRERMSADSENLISLNFNR